MPITFGCPSCGKLMRVADALANTSVRCPHCKAIATAPDDIPIAPVVEPPPPEPRLSLEELPPLPEPESPPEVWNKPGQKKKGPRPKYSVWNGFATGCQLVGIGSWIEFLAYAVVFAFVFYAAVTTEAAARPDGRPFFGAGILFILFFVLLLIASVVTAVGRVRMRAIPDGSGAGGILSTAAALCVLRPVLLLAGLVIGLVEMGDRPGSFAGVASACLVAALMFGWLADLAMIPAMGIVGGAVPSARLRHAAGRLCLALLLTCVAWFVLLGAVGLFTDDSPYGRFAPGTSPARRAAGSVTDSAPMVLVIVVFVVLMVVFTVLHRALYSAGQSAPLEAHKAAA